MTMIATTLSRLCILLVPFLPKKRNKVALGRPRQLFVESGHRPPSSYSVFLIEQELVPSIMVCICFGRTLWVYLVQISLDPPSGGRYWGRLA